MSDGTQTIDASLSSGLRLGLVLLVLASLAAQARVLPMRPVDLSEAEERQIRRVLQLESNLESNLGPSSVLSIRGFEPLDTGAAQPPVSATVTVSVDRLTPSLQSGLQVPCHRTDSIWACDSSSALEVLILDFPDDCRARPVPLLGEARLAVPRVVAPPIEAMPAIVALVCNSDRMADKAWTQGHTVTALRVNPDGETEVLTAAPGDAWMGFVWVLGERCIEEDRAEEDRTEEDRADGECSLAIVSESGWMA